jgi:hypothetical protein
MILIVFFFNELQARGTISTEPFQLVFMTVINFIYKYLKPAFYDSLLTGLRSQSKVNLLLQSGSNQMLWEFLKLLIHSYSEKQTKNFMEQSPSWEAKTSWFRGFL